MDELESGPKRSKKCRLILCSSVQRRQASVCPQNRAYGTVNGSSRKIDPLIHVKPVCELLVGPNGLSFNLDKPLIRVSSVLLSAQRFRLVKATAAAFGQTGAKMLSILGAL